MRRNDIAFWAGAAVFLLAILLATLLVRNEYPFFAGYVILQFIVLGATSVFLNTIADLVVVFMAAPLERKLKNSVHFRRRQRVASGVGMIGLGAYVALTEHK